MAAGGGRSRHARSVLVQLGIDQKCHKDRGVLVYIDGSTQKPVAYQWGGLTRPGILQVHSAYRRRGIGKKLVERCVSLASKRNDCLLFIECTPSSSTPFWEAMGFTMRQDDDGKIRAYRTLPKSLALPEHGTLVNATVRFFPEERKWNPNAGPLVEFSPAARRTIDGVIHFGQRVLFHEEEHPGARDVVVEVELNGRRAYLDKAKYESSTQLGGCSNGYYIDRIREP